MKIVILKDHYSGLKKDQVIESIHIDRMNKLVEEGYAEILSKAPKVEEEKVLSTNNPVETTKELKSTAPKKKK